jgi:hypothetical protein
MDPVKKDLYTAKRTSGIDVSSPEVQEAIEKLRSDADETNWIILKVANGNKVELHGLGACGIGEFSANLNDDDVYYGAIRCTVAKRERFYHVFFMGLKVAGLKKGKATMYKSAIFSLIDAHGEISCSGGSSEYSEEFVFNQIAKLSGSIDIWSGQRPNL